MTLLFLIIINGVTMSSHEVAGNDWQKCLEGRDRARANFEAMVETNGRSPIDAQFVCVFRPNPMPSGKPA